MLCLICFAWTAETECLHLEKEHVNICPLLYNFFFLTQTLCCTLCFILSKDDGYTNKVNGLFKSITSNSETYI